MSLYEAPSDCNLRMAIGHRMPTVPWHTCLWSQHRRRASASRPELGLWMSEPLSRLRMLVISGWLSGIGCPPSRGTHASGLSIVGESPSRGLHVSGRSIVGDSPSCGLHASGLSIVGDSPFRGTHVIGLSIVGESPSRCLHANNAVYISAPKGLTYP